MPTTPLSANPALAAYDAAVRRSAGGVSTTDAPSFGDLLAQSVNDAVETGRKSEAISLQAVSGHADLQDVVEAVNAAEISLQTVVSIRDRMITAYQEILRMPI